MIEIFKLENIAHEHRKNPLDIIKSQTEIALLYHKLKLETMNELKHMSHELKMNLRRFASTINGSIFYVQEGHFGIELEKLTLLEKTFV